MRPDTGSLVRAIVYGVALLYLFVDLFVVKGPLYRGVKNSNPRSEKVIAEETARGVAARVFFQPILLTQIDRAVERRFWLRGKNPQSLSKESLRIERMAALNEIFEEHLLRIKVRFNADEIGISDQEVAAELKLFQQRFINEQSLTDALANQGWQGEPELIARVRAKLEQENYLEKYVEFEISEKELFDFYEEYRGRFEFPERIRVRHIFFAHLQNPQGKARRLAQSIKESLLAGEDFAKLAATHSEDSASKTQGGELNWMTRDRLPKEFAENLFALPVGGYHLVDSKLGSHLIEVLAKEAPRARTFDEIKDELREALSNQRRDQGTKEYLRALHHRESNKLEIFSEILDRPWSL